jgi:hypothetical protein
MKNQSLGRKIFFLIIIKIFLLTCLWKLCFDRPLPIEDRKMGINQIYFSKTGDSE